MIWVSREGNELRRERHCFERRLDRMSVQCDNCQVDRASNYRSLSKDIRSGAMIQLSDLPKLRDRNVFPVSAVLSSETSFPCELVLI
jgi:hypothetical protein